MSYLEFMAVLLGFGSLITTVVAIIIETKSIKDETMIYEKPRIITEEEAAELHRKKNTDRFTEDFLKFAYIKCAHCGKELTYKPALPRNCEFLHMGEDGKLCFVNPELVEPYCLDCILQLGGKSDALHV